MYHIGVIMPSDPQQHIMQYKNRAAWNQVRWVIQIIQANTFTIDASGPARKKLEIKYF